MSTAELAGVPISALGEKVDSLREQRNAIISGRTRFLIYWLLKYFGPG